MPIKRNAILSTTWAIVFVCKQSVLAEKWTSSRPFPHFSFLISWDIAALPDELVWDRER